MGRLRGWFSGADKPTAEQVIRDLEAEIEGPTRDDEATRDPRHRAGSHVAERASPSAERYLREARPDRMPELSREPDYERILSGAEGLLERLGSRVSVSLHDFTTADDFINGIRERELKPKRQKERLQAVKEGLAGQADYHEVKEVRRELTALLDGTDSATSVAEIAVAMQRVSLEDVARVYSGLTRLDKRDDLPNGLQEAVDGQLLNARDVPVLGFLLTARSYQSNTLAPSESDVSLALNHLNVLSNPDRVPKPLRKHVKVLRSGLRNHPTRMFAEAAEYMRIVETGRDSEGKPAGFDPARGQVIYDRLRQFLTFEESEGVRVYDEHRGSYRERARALRRQMRTYRSSLNLLARAQEYVTRTDGQITDMDENARLRSGLDTIIESRDVNQHPNSIVAKAKEVRAGIGANSDISADVRPAMSVGESTTYEGATHDRYGLPLDRGESLRGRSVRQQSDPTLARGRMNEGHVLVISGFYPSDSGQGYTARHGQNRVFLRECDNCDIGPDDELEVRVEWKNTVKPGFYDVNLTDPASVRLREDVRPSGEFDSIFDGGLF